MISKEAKIVNGYGIHCRPSAEIVKQTMKYEGDITISVDGREAGAKSIIELLSLGIKCDDVITITVDGPDEQNEVEALVELFQTNFDFKR